MEISKLINARALPSYIALLVALGSGSLAHAQQASDTQANDTSRLDEIVVTARKRSENLQETPISIAAFSGDSLEERQFNSSDQLSQVIPNLSFDANAPISGSNSAAQIFIRGVGQTDFQASNDPGVGVYVDGVYYARSVGSVFALLDVEKIEVLRGPQGTLFGRNTIGGAIDVSTKKPNFDEFSGYLKGSTGTGNRADVVLGLNVPMADNIAFNVMAAMQNQDGYITRFNGGDDLGDSNSDHLRARLYAEPTDKLSVDVIADWTQENEQGAPLVFSRINTSAAFPRFASFDAGCTGQASANSPVPENNDPNCANNQFTALQPDGTSQNFPTFSKLEHWGLSSTIQYDLGFANFKSITSYRELEASSSRDADNTPLQVLHTQFATEDQQFSQEFQLGGDAVDGRLNWLVGAYYFDQHADDSNIVDLPTRTGSTILAGPVDITSKAVFAQATYDVTDRLSATFGVRYTDEEKKFLPQPRVISPTLTLALPDAFVTPEYVALLNELSPAGAPPTVIDIPPPVTLAILREGTFLLRPQETISAAKETTFMANLAYQATDEALVYATFSQGFKGGGLNFRVIEPEFTPVEFTPEFVDQYELGLKSDWFDNRLRTNVSAFLTKYNDIQVVVTPVLTPTTINAASGEASGFEFEFTALPTSNIEITGGLGLTNTKYTSLDPRAINFGGLSLDNVFQQTPKWNASLGASYRIDLANGYTLTPRVDYSYKSKRFFNAVNTETLSQDAFSLINAAVAFKTEDHITATLGVRNLTDKVFKTGGFSSFNSAAGYEEIGFSRGREWIASLKYDF